MNSKQSYMTIPLGDKAHGYARNFAKLQPDPAKAIQVYRNILTVYAAHCYLQILQIESDLEQSEGWNLAIATLQDVASLHLPEFGDLECRLVSLDDKSIDLPTHTKEDKIGLLVFRTDTTDVTQIEEMEAISFVKNMKELPLEISDLPSTDYLLDRLESIQGLDELLTQAQIYVPDLSIEEIKSELQKIYDRSDDLRFEYNISKFLKAGRERSKQRVVEGLASLEKILQQQNQEPALAREQKTNPDRELLALAAKLAELLQDLWGQLEEG